MGRLDDNPPPQFCDDSSPMEPPAHEDAAYMGTGDHNDENMNARSYVPQSNENMPPPEAYPPQKPAATYPPQQPPPASYPPQQSPASYPPQPYVPQSNENMPPPEAYPPQKPAATYPPQQPPPASYPPQQSPASYPPQPVQFPPQQQPVQFPPQTQPYAHANAQPQVYQQTPVKAEGFAIGSQYLAPTNAWTNNNGLFDCANDPENAIITACCPCITFGQIAEIVDNGQSSCSTSGLIYCLIASFIGIPCIISCSYRTKIRNRYGLMETPAPDWATHCFCEWCALCQEFRELKARGLDPAIGWQGNMIRNQHMQQYPTTTTPPVNQSMM